MFEIGEKVIARQGGKDLRGTITGKHGTADYYAVQLENGNLIYQYGNDMKKEDETMTTLEKITADMGNHYTNRSAWDKGVADIAADLIKEYADNYGENAAAPTMDDLLNGASSWKQYSWGGGYLIYDGDIAKLLCTPSELKKTRYGERRPNSQEEWLDVQARALYQAAQRIISSARRVCEDV